MKPLLFLLLCVPAGAQTGGGDISYTPSENILVASTLIPESCEWFSAHEVDGHCELTLTFTVTVENLDCSVNVSAQKVTCTFDKPEPKKKEVQP